MFVSEPKMLHKEGFTKRHNTIKYDDYSISPNITKSNQSLKLTTINMKGEGKIDVQLFNLPSIKDRMISFITIKECIEKNYLL